MTGVCIREEAETVRDEGSGGKRPPAPRCVGREGWRRGAARRTSTGGAVMRLSAVSAFAMRGSFEWSRGPGDLPSGDGLRLAVGLEDGSLSAALWFRRRACSARRHGELTLGTLMRVLDLGLQEGGEQRASRVESRAESSR